MLSDMPTMYGRLMLFFGELGMPLFLAALDRTSQALLDAVEDKRGRLGGCEFD